MFEYHVSRCKRQRCYRPPKAASNSAVQERCSEAKQPHKTEYENEHIKSAPLLYILRATPSFKIRRLFLLGVSPSGVLTKYLLTYVLRTLNADSSKPTRPAGMEQRVAVPQEWFRDRLYSAFRIGF